MENMTMSVEDYLETIYVLGRDGFVKSTDVAAVLRVSRRPSTKPWGSLSQKDLSTNTLTAKLDLPTKDLPPRKKCTPVIRFLTIF